MQGRALEFCTTREIITRLLEQFPGKVGITNRYKDAQLQGRAVLRDRGRRAQDRGRRPGFP